MHVFIVGVTGGVGSLLAHELVARGDTVSGLVRHPAQRDELVTSGVTAGVGDLTLLSPGDLAPMIAYADAIVFTAGAGGGGTQATTAIDRDGVVKLIDAAHLTSVPPRFVLVSVFPEAWRERNLGPGFDHYIRVKKEADVALTKSKLSWVILRPSALQDDPGRGTVALGPAEIHDEITRADVAATLAAIVHEPRISQKILEVTAGTTPIDRAVASAI
ncbi:NAD(P)H-binding protein [Aeromicrobium wangtongii]|uniref:NAD(P)H-binding protein n=1 Tax=Aeromicrobium wangtongii TaxID=2969247 RepID=UPI0020175FF1|nr:NAD(P)H-binding protein [Aeromicrobium wangtongii]MCL3818588.1 NAD(P)H-binding protein [Aeromicrobium wangtongii]